MNGRGATRGSTPRRPFEPQQHLGSASTAVKLDGVKTHLWDNLGGGCGLEVVEDSPKVLENKLPRCLLAEAVAENGAPVLGHACYSASDLGFCQGLNLDIQFARTKTIMRGNDCCNHRYELRETSGRGKAAGPQDASVGGRAKRLVTRFSRGFWRR